MQFVWMGFLKPGEEIDQALQQQISGFLEQPFIPISSAGVLRDAAGERAGYLVIFDAGSRAPAQGLVASNAVGHPGLLSQ